MRQNSSGFVNQIGLYSVIAYCVLRVVEVTYVRAPILWLFYILPLLSAYAVILWGGRLKSEELHLPRGFAVGIGLLLSMTLAYWMQLAFLAEAIDSLGRSTFEYTRGILITGYLWVLVGSSVSFSTPRRTIYAPLLILAPCLISSIGALDGGYLINYSALQAQASFEDLSHLYLAENMIVAGFAAYALSPVNVRPLVFLVASMLVFICNGRSSFFIGVSVILIFEYLYGDKRRVAIYAGFGISLAIAAISMLDSSDPLVRRMFFVDGVLADASQVDRAEFFLSGFADLGSQAFVGNPALIVDRFGSLGAFMHNLLSAWQFFGLAAFLLVALALLYSVRRMHAVMRLRAYGPAAEFGALLLLYASLSALLSKFIGFYILWFAIGFWCLSANCAGLKRGAVKGAAQ